MQLVAPDILADARGLSPALCVVGLVVGAALWSSGWWSHRFWVVLITTVVGGICGLYEGPTLRAQPMVAAILLAIAGGVLALTLVRLVAFAAGGLTLLVAANSLGPSGEAALTLFLAGGLFGLILLRLWIMVLTSLGGSLLMGYSGLCLLDSLGQLNAATWAGRNTGLLNGVAGAVALLGLLLQLFLNRQRGEGKAKGKKAKAPKPKEESPPEPPPPARKNVLLRIGGELFRRAG
jgi:hypothetical protein